MSDFNPGEVDRLAELVRLNLSDEEKAEFSEQLPNILNFVERLQSAKVDNHDQPLTISQDSLREDEVSGKRLSSEQLEALAPELRDNQIVVPPVFGESSDL